MFVFFRDSFIARTDRYKWAEPFIYYRNGELNTSLIESKKRQFDFTNTYNILGPKISKESLFLLLIYFYLKYGFTPLILPSFRPIQLIECQPKAAARNCGGLFQHGGSAEKTSGDWWRVWNHKVPDGLQFGRCVDDCVCVAEQGTQIVRKSDTCVYVSASIRDVYFKRENDGHDATQFRQPHVS